MRAVHLKRCGIVGIRGSRKKQRQLAWSKNEKVGNLFAKSLSVGAHRKDEAHDEGDVNRSYPHELGRRSGTGLIWEVPACHRRLNLPTKAENDARPKL